MKQTLYSDNLNTQVIPHWDKHLTSRHIFIDKSVNNEVDQHYIYIFGKLTKSTGSRLDRSKEIQEEGSKLKQ